MLHLPAQLLIKLLSFFNTRAKLGDEPVETISYPAKPYKTEYGMPKLVREKCSLSSECAKVCPTKAIVVGGNFFEIDYGKCINCGECIKACPNNALVGLTTLELATANRSDLIFIYRHNG